MKKPIFPRILLLVLIYCGIFVTLASIQFAKKGGFTRRVGNFVVSGRYRLGENDQSRGSNEYFLDGDVHVFFGGMDFGIVNGDDGYSFMLINTEGAKEEALPERMVISGDSVYFVFSGGTELEFNTQYSGGAPGMWISGVFPEDITAAELPLKPLRKTIIEDSGDGQLSVNADGKNYYFSHSPIDTGQMMLLVASQNTPVIYQAIPERRTFSPDDFILSQAKTVESYNAFLTRWRDQNFSLWNRIIQEQNNEDMVIAFEGEALVRGTYKASVAAVSSGFLRSTVRTYESSVYLGSLDQAYRSLIAREREKIARLSRQINEKSLEFLKEPRVFEYFAVRGHNNFIDAGADLVRSIDPAILALDISPGILEGYVDWKIFRPDTENPFERLVDQACFVISESLLLAGKTAGNDTEGTGIRVFSFYGNQGDTEFNVRLGKALMVYAESVNDDSWAGIGRSLVISALSLGDASGMVRAGLVISGTGETIESTDRSELTTARLYRILCPLNTYPRALVVSSLPNNIWTWTAAQTVSANNQNDILDIKVQFPAGETHYMLIRGIRPFSRIQLYNMDFRSDPQFERYDSSGWVYYSQDQVLVLKMKHRTIDESIRIIFREAARPPVQQTVLNSTNDLDEPAEQ